MAEAVALIVPDPERLVFITMEYKRNKKGKKKKRGVVTADCLATVCVYVPVYGKYSTSASYGDVAHSRTPV
jgi:hypothetical protein